VSRTDIFSISLVRSGRNISLRLSMNSSRSVHRVAAVASGLLVSARWLLKLPDPLAMQIQEPKTKVVPSSSMTLVKSKDAIEFSGGCSMNTPTWHARCQCLTSKPTRGYPRGARNTRFRQVWTTESVIPYVICGGLYCLGC
jgi:hypothetical protein